MWNWGENRAEKLVEAASSGRMMDPVELHQQGGVNGVGYHVHVEAR
jgi:hypothetical protein